MPIEATGQQSYEQAIKLAQRKKEVEDEENRLIRQSAQAKRELEKQGTAQREVAEENLVKISKEASAKADALKQSQNNSIRLINQQTQEHVEKLSKDTAARIAELDERAFQQIASHQASAMERIKTVDNKLEDPFYRMRSLNAEVKESEKGYEVRVKVPAHEADTFFASADKNQLKLSLARSFQDNLDLEDGRKHKTSSHQTIVETVNLPTRVDPSTVQREYKDGYIIYKVDKLV